MSEKRGKSTHFDHRLRYFQVIIGLILQQPHTGGLISSFDKEETEVQTARGLAKVTHVQVMELGWLFRTAVAVVCLGQDKLIWGPSGQSGASSIHSGETVDQRCQRPDK